MKRAQKMRIGILIIAAIIIAMGIWIFENNIGSGGNRVVARTNQSFHNSPVISTVINTYQKEIWCFNDQEFEVVIADTPTQQSKGLSQTEFLPTTHAMAFIYNEEAPRGFWMKQMNYPLDIVWLDGQYQTVHTEHDLLPRTYPKIFGNHVDAQYVIEFSAAVFDQDAEITFCGRTAAA